MIQCNFFGDCCLRNKKKSTQPTHHTKCDIIYRKEFPPVTQMGGVREESVVPHTIRCELYVWLR